MSTVSANHDAAILTRVLESDAVNVSPDAARSLLALRFDPADEARVQVLSDKARSGTLTESEQAELDSFHRVGHLVELLWARARKALRDARD